MISTSTLEPLEKQEKEEESEKDQEKLSGTPSLVEENELDEETPKTETKRKVGVPKGDLIPVHMYGILRGDYKCNICTKTHDFFNTNRARKFFKYKHVDFLSPKGKKTAEKEGFTDMPMIKYLPPGENKWQWVQGFDENFWEEMMN